LPGRRDQKGVEGEMVGGGDKLGKKKLRLKRISR